MARGPSDQLVGPSEMILHSKKSPPFQAGPPLLNNIRLVNLIDRVYCVDQSKSVVQTPTSLQIVHKRSGNNSGIRQDRLEFRATKRVRIVSAAQIVECRVRVVAVYAKPNFVTRSESVEVEGNGATWTSCRSSGNESWSCRRAEGCRKFIDIEDQ